MKIGKAHDPVQTPRVHQLFEALQREGFYLRPDDYLEVETVLSVFKPQNFDELKPLLAPLIVTSQEEQEKFDQVFEKVAADAGNDAMYVMPPPPPPPWKKNAVLWALALLCVTLASIIFPRPVFNPNIRTLTDVSRILQVGDTLEFAVDSTLALAGGEFAKWQWTLPGESRTSKPTVRVVADKPGILAVKLQSSRGTGLLFTRWADSLSSVEYPVCAALPKVSFNQAVSTETDADGSSAIRTAATIEGSAPQATQWLVDEKIVASNSLALAYQFPSSSVPSAHTLSFRAIPDTNFPHCYAEARMVSLTIPANREQHFTLSASNSGRPFVLQTILSRSFQVMIAIAAIMVVSLIGAFGWLFMKDRKKQREQIKKEDDANLMPEFRSDEPPYEIPFENRDSELIIRDQTFYQVVRTLRQPVEADRPNLHIGMSVGATIREGGFPTLVYRAGQQETEYLFLIDKKSVRSAQVALFDYVWRSFVGENVCAERFYFDKDFDLFINEMHPVGLSLSQLTDRYKQLTLLIWGDGYQILSPAFPVLEKNIKNAFSDWPARAILTPVPLPDWGAKERALQECFTLLPADLNGQIQLIQSLTDGQTERQAIFSQHAKSFYSIAYVDFEDIDDLKNYTGEALFQWVAALAIYPRLRWEIIVEFGHVVMPASEVSFTNLLKISRIAWVHAGSIPAHFRLGLLKNLTPANEVKVRVCLLRMMRYADHYFPGGHFFDEEKFLIQKANEFILFGYDPIANERYSDPGQVFRKLYEQGKFPDAVTLKYLENPDKKWESLISPLAKPKLPRSLDNATNRIRKIIAAALAVVSLILAGLVFFANRPENREVDMSQQVSFTVDVGDGDSGCDSPSLQQPIIQINDSTVRYENILEPLRFPLTRLIDTTRKDSLKMRLTIAIEDTISNEVIQFATTVLARDSVHLLVNCGAAQVPMDSASAETVPELQSQTLPLESKKSSKLPSRKKGDSGSSKKGAPVASEVSTDTKDSSDPPAANAGKYISNADLLAAERRKRDSVRIAAVRDSVRTLAVRDSMRNMAVRDSIRRDSMNEALKNAADSAARLRTAGEAQMKSNNSGAALKLFDAALRLRPQDTATLALKGELMLNMRNYRSAVEVLSGLTQINPKNPAVLFNLVKAYCGLRDSQNTTRIYRELIYLAPEYEQTTRNDKMFMKECGSMLYEAPVKKK